MIGAARWARAGLVALGCLAGFASFGCGYRLTGSNSFLPETIRAIAIQPFENRTTRPEIEQRVTEEVARELSRRGRYRVVTDRAIADALLEGAVTSYRTSPIAFDAEGRASRVEAVVTVRSTLRELTTDKVLWSQEGLIFREQFEIQPSGEFIDQEDIALDQIAKGAAEALITSILEGF